MKKHLRRILLTGGILLVLIGVGVAWHLSTQQAAVSSPDGSTGRSRPVQVDAEPVRRGSIAQRLALSGEVIAADSVVIAATKEGPIAYCPWREGDEVRGPRLDGQTVIRGDRLIEIDREVHRAEVQAAEAVLAVARTRLAHLTAGTRPEELHKVEATVQRWQATLAEARRSYDRQEQLIADEFTSQQSVDQARERMQVAQAELTAAREMLRMLQTGPTETEIAVQESAVEEAVARMSLASAHLSECVITAPFDGVITAVHVRPGDLATPRAPLLEMYDPSSLVIRFSVPESQTGRIAAGMTASVVLDAFPGQTFHGQIVRLYPSLDRRSRARPVELQLLDGPGIVPGMFARVELELARVEDAMLIPDRAVFERNGRMAVFVFEQGTLHLRQVSLGLSDGRHVQVLDGLEEGVMVVTTMPNGLRDGAAARTSSPGSRSANQGARGRP